MCDIWRSQHGEEFKYTWARFNPKVVMERFDYIFVTNNMKEEVNLTGIIPSYKSDHAMLYIIYKPRKSTRGPGFWHLNNLLLQDKNYTGEICAIIKDTKNEKIDIMKKWELLQFRVKIIFCEILNKQTENQKEYATYNRKETETIHKRANYWL